MDIKDVQRATFLYSARLCDEKRMSPVVPLSLAAHAQLLDGDVYASPPACLAHSFRLNVATSTIVGTALPESINMQHQIDEFVAWLRQIRWGQKHAKSGSTQCWCGCWVGLDSDIILGLSLSSQRSVAEKGILQSDVVTDSEDDFFKLIVGADSNVIFFE